MEDSGWRRNKKTGGWFNINNVSSGGGRIGISTNDYMNDKIRQNVKKDNNNQKYQLTDKQIQQVIDESISKYDDNYAKLYISKISPDDFLNLTTSENVYNIIKDETKKLDVSKIQNAQYVADMMYLDIDMKTGQVSGHEGRHRMMAFKNAGYKEVDIVVWPNNYEKYNAQEYTNLKINAQNAKDYNTVLKTIVPVSKKNINRIKKRDY